MKCHLPDRGNGFCGGLDKVVTDSDMTGRQDSWKSELLSGCIKT